MVKKSARRKRRKHTPVFKAQGVDGGRLKTEGKGKANPVVVCTDKKRSALINCLEPNRRVEVQEMTFEPSNVGCSKPHYRTAGQIY